MRARDHGGGLVRKALRFVAAVLMTSGALMLADAALTLVWQEPISAVIGWRGQSDLADQLEAEEALAAEAGASALSDEALRQAARRYAARTQAGEAFGRIALPTLGRDYAMVEGTDPGPLRKGPGHYPDTAFPGAGRTVAVAGHRTTYLAPFRTIDKLRRGDEIVLSMPYATLTYAVERTRIVPPTQTSVTRDVGHEQLVLSACHPLYSAAERLIVFARLARAEAP